MRLPVFCLFTLLVPAFQPTPVSAASLDRGTFTEVVNNVSVIQPSTRKTTSAKVQQVVNAPEIIRTGANSRAELIAEDKTVTRVGQNTLFSFQPDSREINLEKGSILFQSPTGKGGGTIRTPAASAAVLGTTLIVTTTKNGGFKVLLVEGKGRIKAGDGSVRTLTDGQMVFAMPGGKLSQVFTFQLSQQVGASKLIKGFKQKLPSSNKIANAISKQEKAIEDGDVQTTNLLAGDSPDYAVQVDVAQDALEDAQEESLIEEGTGLSPFQQAITTDAIIAAPELDPFFLFTFDGPNFPELEESPRRADTLANGETSGSTSDAALFAAQKITFDSPNVDLTAFEGRSLFQFFSLGDIDFAESVDFSGLSSTELQLVAGGTFSAAPGTTLTSNTSNFVMVNLGQGGVDPESGSGVDSSSLATDQPLELTDFTINNPGGNILLGAGESIFKGLKIDAGGDFRAHAGRDFILDSDVEVPMPTPRTDGPGSTEGSTAGGSPFDPTQAEGANNLKAAGVIKVDAGRDIHMRATATKAKRTFLRAGQNIRLQGVAMADDGTAPSKFTNFRPTIDLRAPNLISITSGLFFATDVMMQAQTIVLRNVRFKDGSRVILESQAGRAHFPGNGPTRMGFVNMVGVKYGDRPVNSPTSPDLVQNGPGAPNRSHGIIVRPKGNPPPPPPNGPGTRARR